MTIPTDEYLEREQLVKRVSEQVAPDLESKFESSGTGLPSPEPSMPLPDHLAFYENGNKIGELYFMKDLAEVVILEEAFRPYAEKLEEVLEI